MIIYCTNRKATRWDLVFGSRFLGACSFPDVSVTDSALQQSSAAFVPFETTPPVREPWLLYWYEWYRTIFWPSYISGWGGGGGPTHKPPLIQHPPCIPVPGTEPRNEIGKKENEYTDWCRKKRRKKRSAKNVRTFGLVEAGRAAPSASQVVLEWDILLDDARRERVVLHVMECEIEMGLDARFCTWFVFGQ